MKNTNGNIQIRQFRGKDLSYVHRLVLDTIDVSYRPDYTPKVIEFFKEYHPRETIRDDAETGYTIVAADDGQIVGTGTLLGTNIRRVFIDTARQRQGIGSLIVNELEKRATREGIHILDLSSALGARTFWETHGYTVREEHFTPAGNNRVIHYYTMMKTLKNTL